MRRLQSAVTGRIIGLCSLFRVQFKPPRRGISVIKARKLSRLEKQMDDAGTYEEWAEAAQAHDELTGQKRWREIDQTSQYD